MTDTPSPDAATGPNSRQLFWRRTARGLTLITFGVFLTLTTSGLLDGWFWLDVLRHWPLFLVIAGIRLILDRNRWPAAALISPAFWIALLSFVAVSQDISSRSPEWESLDVERPADTTAWQLDATAIRADGRIAARALGPTRLVHGRWAPSDEIAVGAENAWTEVQLGVNDDVHLLPSEPSRWELEVADDLPLDLELRVVMSDFDIDLRSAPAVGGSLAGAFHDVVLHLPAPSEDTSIDLSGAFNRVTLVVPPDVPVSTRRSGPLNRVTGRSQPPRSDSAPRYVVRLEGLGNRLRVRSEVAAVTG